MRAKRYIDGVGCLVCALIVCGAAREQGMSVLTEPEVVVFALSAVFFGWSAFAAALDAGEEWK